MREIAFSNKINKWIIQEPSSAPYKYYTYLRVNSYIQYVIIIYYVGCVGYVIKLKKKKLVKNIYSKVFQPTLHTLHNTLKNTTNPR